MSTTEQESRQVAEQARETEWEGRTFLQWRQTTAPPASLRSGRTSSDRRITIRHGIDVLGTEVAWTIGHWDKN